MVPDIPLFVPIVNYAATHSGIGIFSHCIPMGVASYLTFDLFCKRPLLGLLHTAIQQRVSTQPTWPNTESLVTQCKFLFIIMVSIALGAASHLAWDAFTHEGRWGTQLVPWLNHDFSFLGTTIPGYKWLQYGSTLIGLPGFAIWLGIQLRKTEPEYAVDQSIPQIWKRLVVCICLTVPFLIGLISIWNENSLPQIVGWTIRISGVSVGFILFAYCAFCQLYYRWQKGPVKE